MSLAVALIAVLTLAGAVWVVTLRNLFRAALALGLVLAGVAALFLVLGAEFVAFVQLLVYVGAILTLIVFAIMLTARLNTAPDTPAPGRKLTAAGVSLALFAVLTAAIQPLADLAPSAAEPVSAAELGHQLVTTLVAPFEIISLVFVAAIVGAIALAAPRAASPEK